MPIPGIRLSDNGHHGEKSLTKSADAINGSTGRGKGIVDDDMLNGTDAIEIGSSAEATDVECATLEDVAKVIDGIKFLVKGWIPFGMVTGLIAEPGVGKSAFALWLAKTITTGGCWFNGKRGPKQLGHVLWCPTENDMAITVQRMRDWNIPMARMLLPFKDDPLQPINLAYQGHLEIVESLINKHRIQAVFIDSLRGGHDGDENCSRVGRVLQSLSQIAERTKAAIIVVHHTKKLVVDEEITANSSRGSNAIVAMMRSQIGIDKPDRESDWCRVRVLKENLGLRPTPVGFRFTDSGLEFGEAPQKKGRKETKGDMAESIIKAHMEKAGEWYPARPIINVCESLGLKQAARDKAADRLKIEKRNGSNGFEWRLPPSEG